MSSDISSSPTCFERSAAAPRSSGDRQPLRRKIAYISIGFPPSESDRVLWRVQSRPSPSSLHGTARLRTSAASVEWSSALVGIGGLVVAGLSLYYGYKARTSPYRERLYDRRLDAYGEMIRRLGELHDEV